VTVVIDASLALKRVLQEEHTEDAVALRDHWLENMESVIAPPIFKPEVTNVLHQRVRRGQLSRRDAADMLEILVSAVAAVEPPSLYSRALTLASELELSSAYDALYLALADSEECEMWTADQRLVRSTQPKFSMLRWLEESP
jgi:predicted nucleic acid-binding protein